MFAGKIFKIVSLTFLAGLFFTAAVSHAADNDKLKKEIRSLLKKHPELVLEVLRENEMALFDIVQGAAVKKRDMAMRSQKANEFRNPLKPVIEKGRMMRGNPKAPITIVEYSDFQCPFCSRGAKTVESLFKKYKGKIRLIYKHNPITNIHPHALPAALYFEAIGKQSEEKAWMFHDIIFADQSKLKAGKKGLNKIVASLNLDEKRLASDIKDPVIKKRIQNDIKEARKFGFTGTPSFLINGVSLKGAYPAKDFSAIIDRFLKK